MKKTILSLGMIIMLVPFVIAQKEALTAIDQNDMKAYMEFFASDDMAGRETGTPQNDISALFLKTRLKHLELKPIPGTGDYLQEIPLISSTIERKNCFLEIIDSKGELIFHTDSVLSLQPPSGTMESKGNLVFAGYGYENPDAGYSDYEGIDINGKIVMIMTRNPAAVKAGEGKTIFDQQLEGMKLSSLIMRNPVAILMVYDPENIYSDAYESGFAEFIGQNTVSLKGSKRGGLPLQLIFITRYAADQLLKPTGFNLKEMQDKITGSGKPVSCEIKDATVVARTETTESEFLANNVVGIIEGSDPVLRNECVLYSAHFDHVGVNDKGEVYNGADDNASGSIAILEIAEAFMKLKKKPPRSIVFVWANGEEKGLLGSQYYADNPVFPMEKTILNINIDMVGRSRMESDTGKFYGFELDVTKPREVYLYTGIENTGLIDLLNTCADKAGIRVYNKGHDIPFGSSDHESFENKGVPAFFFHSGIHRDLHQVGDDVEKIDFDKMERSARLCFLLGYEIANKPKKYTFDQP